MNSIQPGKCQRAPRTRSNRDVIPVEEDILNSFILYAQQNEWTHKEFKHVG